MNTRKNLLVAASLGLFALSTFCPQASRASEVSDEPCTATCTMYDATKPGEPEIGSTTVTAKDVYELKVSCWEATGDNLSVGWEITNVSDDCPL